MAEQKFKHRSIRNANWDTMPLVEGILVDRGTHKDDKRDAPYIVIDTTVSLVRIYESKDLEDVFKHVKPGDHVRVEFLESVNLPGGKRFTRFDNSTCHFIDKPVAAVQREAHGLKNG